MHYSVPHTVQEEKKKKKCTSGIWMIQSFNEAWNVIRFMLSLHVHICREKEAALPGADTE